MFIGVCVCVCVQECISCDLLAAAAASLIKQAMAREGETARKKERESSLECHRLLPIVAAVDAYQRATSRQQLMIKL